MSLRIRNWKDHFENAESRKLKRLSWVGVPNKMHGNGYNALVGHPNGAAHLGAWYAIVEVCSLREPRELRGNLPESDGTIGGISRALGRISRLPVELFAEVLPRLIHDPDIQWIEQYGDIPGENPGTSGENPETPAANRRGLEGIGGEGKEKEPPKPPASGETLFDEQTSTNSPSVVRPDVPPAPQKRKNGSGRPMSADQREWLNEFLALHPKNTIQTASATKLWSERVKEKPCFEWLMAQLKRECAGDTTYLHGPGKWLADHLELYAAGIRPVDSKSLRRESEHEIHYAKL